jgi:uncharacterized phage-associated protein
MLLEPSYTKAQISKLGNSIIYLAERISPLSKTKLIKLIYLIEEISIKKFGIPFFDLRFDVWKLGPVSRDLYVELTGDPVLLNEYIIKEQLDENIFVKPKISFIDDEFSDNDIKVLDLVVDHYATTSTQELIKLTHRQHSPWYITAKEHDLLEKFEQGLLNTTDIEIDLSKLISDDPIKKAFYLENKEIRSLARTLQY